MQKALPSKSLESAVRAGLGLTQAQLAQYLGVTRGQVAHAEAGRRVISGEASRRLFQLAALLPPPLGEGPPEPAPDAPAPAEPLDPNPLRRRQRRCTWQAANLRLELEKLVARARQARRWQQALPGLLAALPTGDPASAQTLRTRRWLAARAAEAVDQLDPANASAQVLLRQRIEHLEADADLKTLNHQAGNIDYQRDNTTESATETVAELASLDAEITSLTALIPTLAVGTTRKKRQTELRKANNRHADLTDRQEQRGAMALLRRELDLAKVQAQNTETQAFKAAVVAHRATL